MRLIEFVENVKKAWNVLFVSRYTSHLEAENEQLKCEVSVLRLKLETALAPKPVVYAPRPTVQTVYKPARTSWESYLEEQIALQDKEAEQSPA